MTLAEAQAAQAAFLAEKAQLITNADLKARSGFAPFIELSGLIRTSLDNAEALIAALVTELESA